MHILITADTVGGVWIYTQELVTGLLARGHRITLVSFGDLPNPTEQYQLDRQENLQYFPTTYRLEWMQDSAQDVAESCSFVSNVIEEVKPDVLHFNQYCYGAVDSEVPKVVVAHSDVVSWWNAVHGTNPPLCEWSEWYQSTVNMGLARADVVIAPSQWMMDALIHHYDVPACRRVIYNGRSASLFDSTRPKNGNALSVGRIWDPGKQAALLFSCKTSTPLHIVGPIKAPGLDASALSIAHRSNIKLCGPQEGKDLRLLYAESGTYIATSQYEPFGLAPVEAALSRCALVTNDLPVFRELWEDAAFFFAKNDADALADVIQQLSDCPELREEYAARAYRRALDRFDAERMVAEYEGLYQQLVCAGAVT
jgi:glycogen synthase